MVDEEYLREQYKVNRDLFQLFLCKLFNKLSLDFIREFRKEIVWSEINYFDLKNEKLILEFKKEILKVIDGEV